MSLDDLSRTPSQTPSGVSGPRPKRSLAWLLPLGLILGFIAVFALLFGERLLPALPARTAPVITLRVASDSENSPPSGIESSTGKGALLFQASGWVEPDPYTTFVPTLIDGVIDEIYVLEGQAVKMGQLLATLIDDNAELDLEAAGQSRLAMEKKIVAHCVSFEIVDAEISASRHKVESLEASLDEAKDNSARIKNLDVGATSRREVVQARLASEKQIALLAEARAEIPRLEARSTQIAAEEDAMRAKLAELTTLTARAQLALDRTKISAPMDGIVLKLHAAPGKKRMLAMDDPTSAVIVELYDPEQLQARIDVPLNEAAALAEGQSVELVSDLLPDRTFTGTVTRISGQADLQRNTLQAKVEIDIPDIRLRPDMLVRAKFFGTSNPKPGAESTARRLSLFVPIEAVIEGSKVWVVTPKNTAELRPIQLGDETREGHQLVLEGLRSGESVILPPHGDLAEGTRLSTTR